jgi:hypothetical protein
MIELSNRAVIEGLKALVDEKGEEFVYVKGDGLDGSTCRYVRNGKPDCMIGQFLAKAGVPLERLARADEPVGFGGGGSPACDLLKELKAEGVVSITDKGIAALQAAQSRQDRDYPWGAALRSAHFEIH